jgi:short-subunit dehydrogenase
MRDQKSGHIIQVSSILGLATLPTMGLYNASKFALEGLSETLATEVKEFGIHVTLVEPNGYASNIWHTGINTQSNPVYDGLKKAFSEAETSFGSVEATAPALIKLAETENPPLRLLLGKVALPFVKQNYEQRLKVWEEWNEVSVEAHG